MTVYTLKTEYFVSRQQECMIIPLWRRGKDTFEIAKALSLPEYEIYNRLLLLREHRLHPQVSTSSIHGLSEKNFGAS